MEKKLLRQPISLLRLLIGNCHFSRNTFVFSVPPEGRGYFACAVVQESEIFDKAAGHQ